MKKNTKKIILSIITACCLIVIPFVEVIGSEIDGGQVSVPGKISFDTGNDSADESIQGPEKKVNENNDKKIFSALPKTGEIKAPIISTIGFSFIIVTLGIYLKRKLVIRDESK